MHVVIAEYRRFPAAKTVERHGHRNWHVDTDHADLDILAEIARNIAVAAVVSS